MPLLTRPTPPGASFVNNLPNKIPDAPSGITDPAVLQWIEQLQDWYNTFLLAYNTQQQQILTKLPTS